MEAQILQLSSGIHPFFTANFVHWVVHFCPIFVLDHDLFFPEFGLIPSDDFWGIVSCLGEFHLTKFWEPFVKIWVGSCWFFWPHCSSVFAVGLLFVSLQWRLCKPAALGWSIRCQSLYLSWLMLASMFQCRPWSTTCCFCFLLFCSVFVSCLWLCRIYFWRVQTDAQHLVFSLNFKNNSSSTVSSRSSSWGQRRAAPPREPFCSLLISASSQASSYGVQLQEQLSHQHSSPCLLLFLIGHWLVFNISCAFCLILIGQVCHLVVVSNSQYYLSLIFLSSISIGAVTMCWYKFRIIGPTVSLFQLWTVQHF